MTTREYKRPYKALILVGIMIAASFMVYPVYRLYRQGLRVRLDRDLIKAIKQKNVPLALSLLRRGADPNAHDLNREEGCHKGDMGKGPPPHIPPNTLLERVRFQ